MELAARADEITSAQPRAWLLCHSTAASAPLLRHSTAASVGVNGLEVAAPLGEFA